MPPAAISITRHRTGHELDDVEGRLTSLMHPDFVHESRRRSDRRLEDRATFIANNTPPPDAFTQRVIAIRAEQLGLTRDVVRWGDDEVAMLTLYKTLDDQIVPVITFAETHLDEAQHEFDRRYLESLGYGADRFLQRMLPTAYSLDPGTMAAALHPELEYIEHRPLTFEGGDRTRVITNMASIDFDAHVVIPAIHRISERAAVWEKREVADSGAGETAMLIVATFKNELCRAREVFEPTALDASLVRYDDLVPASDSGAAN